MKHYACILSFLFLLSAQVYSQETIVLEEENIETDSHSWSIISVNITDDYVVVKKLVSPKVYPTWICNSKSEFIEDAQTHERAYIVSSDIGFVPEKYVLNDKPLIFEERYPKFTEKTKSIHVSAGQQYYAKDVELDWAGYKDSYYRRHFLHATLEAMQQEDYQRALSLAKRQLKVAQDQFGIKNANTASAYGIVGMCYANIAEYQLAIAFAEKSLSIYQKNYNKVLGFEHHPDEIAIINNLGEYHACLGNYMLAIEHARKVSDISKKMYGETSLPYAQSLLNLATYNELIGNLEEGVSLLSKGKQLCKSFIDGQDKNREMLETLLENFESLGDQTNYLKTKQKLDRYQSSVATLYTSILNNLGICLWKSKRQEEALEVMKMSTELRRSTFGSNHSSYAESLMNQALYEKFFYQKDISQELELVYRIFQQNFGPNHPTTALVLNNLALSEENAGNKTQAIAYAKEALRIREQVYGKSHIDYIRGLLTLSMCLSEANRASELRDVVNEELNVTGRYCLSNLRLMTATQRNRYWNTMKLYADIPLLVVSNKLEQDDELLKASYNALLQSKGLLLTSSIDFEKDLRKNKNKQLSDQFERMKSLQRRYNFYANRPLANRPLEVMNAWKTEALTLEQQLVNESRAYADFTRRLKTTWVDVQRALKEDEMAVEFVYADFHIKNVTEPYYAALVLKKGWKAPKKIALCKGDYINQLAKRGPSLYASAEGTRLYSVLFGQLEAWIKEGDRIYFSPAGAIHHMNLGALADSQGRFAGEKYQLYRLSSTREICDRRTEATTASAVLFGGLTYRMSVEDLKHSSMSCMGETYPDYKSYLATRKLNRGRIAELPGTYMEVKRIEKSLLESKIRVQSYVGKLGVEAAFKSLSGHSPSILHIATHGFCLKNETAKGLSFYEQLGSKSSSDDNPLQRTGLIFAGGDHAWNGEGIPEAIDDGVLLADEISALDLSTTDLAVLSACQTGLGEVSSEGVFGLQRGFKLAGVQSIMMSLWKIDDRATSILMDAFYRAYMQGKSKHDAFIEAQQTLRKYKKYESPYYWASFIILD